MNAAWAFAMLGGVLALVVGNAWVRIAVMTAAGFVLVRKFVQTRLKGHTARVALVYALHTYFSKLSIAWGELRWFSRHIRRKVTGQ